MTLRDSTDCSLPGSFVHGIFQARILEWVAVSYSRMFGMVWQLWIVCKISSVGEALGEPFKAVDPHCLETESEHWAYRWGDWAGGGSVRLGTVLWELHREDSVGLAATSADLRLCYFHWKLPIAQEGKLQQHGFAASCLMMANVSHEPPGEGSWDAVLCHTAPRGLWLLFCLLVCVYFDCHLKCRAPGSHPLFSWGWHSLLPFGSFDSLNFHPLSLSLFPLFLVSQLTALGTKRTRSLRAYGFLATPQSNMSVCFLK